MIFAGLGFAQLAAIFGIVGAAVVGLYVLRLRRRTVAIPFSPLWQRILKDKEATTLFSRLKRLLSLLLQLALLALLVFALGDPRAAATLVKGRTLVVLIDASASMQATDVAPSRLEVAKNEVKAMIRGLGGADRMLIAQMDAMVTPLGPMSGDTSELERALDEVKATDARADFPRALRFATDTLRNVELGEIVVVSDGNLGPALDASGPVHLGDDKLSFVAVGTGKRNVGITQFSVRRYPLDKSRYEVMLEVTNTGPEQQDIELKLLGDGNVVDLTKLRLMPGERLPRFYPNLSGASRTLEASLTNVDGSHDDLPADDRAYALLPERRRAKVLVVTEGNTYLEAALLLDEYLDVTMVNPTEYVNKHASGGGFEVIIFDRVTPASPPRAHALYLDPRGPGSPVKIEAELVSPGFDKIDRKHPIVRFTALDDVNIARGHKLVPQATDKVVGSFAGSSPILVAGARGAYKFVAVGFDVRDSDLPLRVAWPLFLLNTVNFFTDEDARYISSFRTGDVWRVPVGTQATEATLTLPGGATEKVPVHEGRAVYLGERAGFYELTAGNVATAPEQPPSALGKTAFAANLLDAEESAITPAPELVVDGKTAGKVEGFHVGVRREIWIYLLLAAVLLTALEWATYHRRVTV
ncbi:VWA domain-containing protein [Pendulispora albinea]|uniref:VWA domain-containing protein n=1 Tax=Pendulispora albinea TaxID=2741071 RepID=A0ABZ2MBT3_9BACT